MNILNNNMEKTLDEKMNELYKFRHELMDKLEIVNKNISLLEKDKVKNCEHIWVVDREDCAYGERYTYCSKCRVDKTY